MATEQEQEIARRYLKLLQKLDDSAKHGPWDKTLILSALGKKITRLRDELSHLLGIEGDFDYEAEMALLERVIAQDADSTPADSYGDTVDIYVVLYCAKGGDLKSWEPLLTNLSTTIVSRPVYANEADAKALIDTKATKGNDAYCVVAIAPDMILKPYSGQSPTDKLGHELLVLNRGAVQKENIKRLVKSGSTFTWKKNRFVE